MYRKYINFYINKNGDLACIWYAQRKGKYVEYGNTYDAQTVKCFEPIGIDDYMYTVRRVTLRRNCDKMHICNVEYDFTEQGARTTIKRWLVTHSKVTADSITDKHLQQLAQCPMKYAQWFFSWLSHKVSEQEHTNLLGRYMEVARAKG